MLLLKAGVAYAAARGDASTSGYLSVSADGFDIHFFGSLAILRCEGRGSLGGN